MLKTASDFIGSVIGKSEEVTNGILEQAKGCVLVIDEAYALYTQGRSGNDPFREAVINTLVEKIQGVPGEDRVVLLLGYRKEMELMLTKCNHGLSRRFQLADALEFSDYDVASLLRILRAQCRKRALVISTDTAEFAVKQLAKTRAMPNFGNVGELNNLLSKAILSMQRRHTNVDELQREDFVPEGWTDEVVSEEALFKRLVGCDAVKKQLSEYRNLIEFTKARGMDPIENLPFNFLFTGAPGTGKTTVARLMGKMFCSLGMIPSEEVVEVSASDLVTGYVNQTGIKTTEMFVKARGKVLFIDEAYQLNPEKGGQFMPEAVDEIVKNLTSKDFEGKLVVILAGYKEPIDTMLGVNRGLASRFTARVPFEDLTEAQVGEIIEQRLQLTESATTSLPEVCRQLKALKGFANGRDVITFAKRVVLEMANRNKVDPTEGVIIADLQAAVSHMVALKSTSEDPKLTEADSARPAVPAQKAQSAVEPVIAYATQTATVTSPPLLAPSLEMRSETTIMPNQSSQTESKGHTYNLFLNQLQKIIDAKQLNSEESMAYLSDNLDSLLDMISAELGVSTDVVRELMTRWRGEQAKLREILRKHEEEVAVAKAHKKKMLVPIWRCGVCGRADQPYIACYVAPFVVRYEERDMSD